MFRVSFDAEDTSYTEFSFRLSARGGKLHATANRYDHRRPKLIVCILYGTSGASDL